MLGLGNSLVAGGASSEFLPTSISNLSVWLKNATGVAVEQWDDSSGNSNHVTQSTSGSQASVSGGGLDFEGDNDDHYDLASAINMGADLPWAAFIVLTMESFDSPNTIASNNSDATMFFEVQNTDQIRYRQTGATSALKFPSTSPFQLSSQMLLTITKDADKNLVVYKNGSALTQESSTNNPANDGDLTFNQFGGRSSGPDRDMDGIIYEFLIYEKVLTSGEVASVNTYLTDKFSL